MTNSKPKAAGTKSQTLPQDSPSHRKKGNGKKPAMVSEAKLRELRASAKVVRRQVAEDAEQIASEARDVVAAAVADGVLTKLTVLIRSDERGVLAAIDEYAAAHGLKSRNQVLRAALSSLLEVELDTPHWGWKKGRARKTKSE
jgi:hypothetical protein